MAGGRRGSSEGVTEIIPERIKPGYPMGHAAASNGWTGRAKGTCVNSSSIPHQGSDILVPGRSVAGCN